MGFILHDKTESKSMSDLQQEIMESQMSQSQYGLHKYLIPSIEKYL